MELYELLGIKNLSDKILDGFPSYPQNKIQKTLLDNGFKLLGKGNYSSVYTHPKFNYALKIFDNDDGYTKFIKYCKQNQSNPHLPKFRGNLMRYKNSSWYAIRMELLQPFTKEEFLQEIYLIKALKEIFDFNNFINSNLSAMKLYDILDQSDSKSYQEWKDKNKLLFQTLKDLDNLDSNSESFNIDLHERNFMRRGKTIVIIDPFA